MAQRKPKGNQIPQQRYHRQLPHGHIITVKAMSLPTDAFMTGMLRLTAGAYALRDGICQPMPNGQHLQTIWKA